jgi:hypothetical protein
VHSSGEGIETANQDITLLLIALDVPIISPIAGRSPNPLTFSELGGLLQQRIGEGQGFLVGLTTGKLGQLIAAHGVV